MPLLYPIAANAREALEAEGGARTLAEAREQAQGPVALVSDWLRPSPGEREALQARAEAAVARGFVQLYEDARGQLVIAVAYWKTGAEPAVAPQRAVPRADTDIAPDDHADDLYFMRADAKARRKKRAIDPNQLDLFGRGRQPDAADDAPSAGVVIIEEEGQAAGRDEEPPA